MPSKSFNHPRKGTTLVEILIFTAVGSLLLFSISSVYISGLRARTLVDAQQRLLYADEFVMAILQSWIVSSSDIASPTTGTTNNLSITALDGSSRTLQLSGTDLTYTTSLPDSGTLNPVGVRITQFDVTRVTGSPDTVRVEMTYEVDTSTQRVLEHETVYTLTTSYD